MKRTRRIEVIRYTRRVTVNEGGGVPHLASQLPAIDLNPVAPAGVDRPAPGAAAVRPQTLRRRMASRLRDLLRLRR